MDCPACHVPMNSTRYGAVEFSACRRCGGLWFGPGELARLLSTDDPSVGAVEAEESDTGAPVTVSVYSCPGCRVALDRYRYQYTSPVDLDGCPRCGGVFVQDEELTEIVKWRDRDLTEETKDSSVAEALSAADGRMVQAIRDSQASARAARALNMRWGLDGGAFKWSTADIFKTESPLPPAPQLPD